jgi:hypothetical protein
MQMTTSKDQEPGECDEDVDPEDMRSPRKKAPDNWQALGAMLILLESWNREGSERREDAHVRRILRDLSKMRKCATNIRQAVAEVEAAYARADQQAKPREGLLGFLVEIAGRFGASRPIATALRKRRQNLEDMLTRVDVVSKDIGEALARQFQARSIRRPKARPGLMRRLGAYEILGWKEDAIAKKESISVGAIHQARQRFKRAGGLKRFEEELEKEGNAEIDPDNLDIELPSSFPSPTL